MTKYEQAIKYFEEQQKVLDDHRKRGGEFAAEALEHTKTAIEALKKQVPRALTTYQVGIKSGICPTCNNIVTDRVNNNCHLCGQNIAFTASMCIAICCANCKNHSVDGPVCKLYADKVDEIRRIHEEA